VRAKVLKVFTSEFYISHTSSWRKTDQSKEPKVPKGQELKIFKKWEIGDGEGDPDHPETWKLFDIFSTSTNPFVCDASSLGTINKTYSPRYVYLSDRWLGRVIESNLVAGSRPDRWPKDFKHKGHIQSGRVPKGMAYYMKDNQDRLRYAIAEGCHQLHGYEGVIRGLKVTRKRNPNAGKKIEEGDLVESSEIKSTSVPTVVPPTSVSTSVPTVVPSTSVPTSVPTVVPSTSVSTSVPTVVPPTSVPSSVPTSVHSSMFPPVPTSLKRRIRGNEDSNPRNSPKNARTKGLEEDFDIIPVLSSEDEGPELNPESRELKDTRLLCEFLFEVARNQGEILVGMGQRYKELLGAEDYSTLKERCKGISESTTAMVGCFLSSYPEGRKMFKASKGSKP